MKRFGQISFLFVVGSLMLSGCGGALKSGVTVAETAAAVSYEGDLRDSAGSGASETGLLGAVPQPAEQEAVKEAVTNTEKEVPIARDSMAGTTGTDASTVMAEEAEAPGQENRTEAASETARKLIRNVSIDAETKQFDELLAVVEERVAALGGYIESMDSYAPAGDSSTEPRSAYINARIPAEKLSEFLNTALSSAHITRKSENTQDVTLQYTDIDARVRTLRIEQERLMELLSEAESADSLIALEERLSEIRYEIESLSSQLRVYDNQVSYSTVHLGITEVKAISTTADDGFSAQLSDGFQRNLHAVGAFFRNAALLVLSGLPIILTVAAIAFLVYHIFRCIRKCSIGKRKERPEKTAVSSPGAKPEHADDKTGEIGSHRS